MINRLMFCTSYRSRIRVLNENFPDPTVIRVGNKYFAYATNGSVDEEKLQYTYCILYRFFKLDNCRVMLLHEKPCGQPRISGPLTFCLIKKLNKYVMFYSGEKGLNTGKCIGVAFSDKPRRPFKDKGLSSHLWGRIY